MALKFFRVQAFALFVLIFSISAVTAETQQERAEALFQEGYTLYQQRYGAVAITPFEQAAKLGHVEAAYWVGEILRKRYSYITEEVEQFYRQAAEGGEIYAMLRFGQKGKMCETLRNCDYDRQVWLDRAIAEALPKAESGDTHAMMAVSLAYGIGGDLKKEFSWVKKAAEQGHAYAQYWFAAGLLDSQKMGFYWTAEGRRKDMLKWLRASAVQGFPKAMKKLTVELRKDGQLTEARHWVEMMAKTDYYDAILEGASQIMMGPDVAKIFSPAMSYHFPESRPIEGAALLFALHRETGKKEPMGMIDDYREHLTPEILAEAEARSKELLVDTPVIYYLPKFGI